MCHPSEKGVKGVAYLARHPFESRKDVKLVCSIPYILCTVLPFHLALCTFRHRVRRTGVLDNDRRVSAVQPHHP